MTSHRLLATNRQDRLGPRSPRCARSSPRSPRLPRPATARVQRCYRQRALLASCISPNRFPLCFLAGDFLESILHRAPLLLPGYLTHASRAMNMDSEDGELFVKVCVDSLASAFTMRKVRSVMKETDNIWKYSNLPHLCVHTRKLWQTLCSYGSRMPHVMAHRTACHRSPLMASHRQPSQNDRPHQERRLQMVSPPPCLLAL